MNIAWVQKDDAPRIWPMVDPFIVSALKRWLPVYRSIDLLECVMKDEMQLWIITNNEEEQLYGAVLTEIKKCPLANICNIFLLGGKDMKKWKDDFCSAMELFARSQKCEYLQGVGRRGWISFPDAFESAVVVNKILI